MVAERWIHQREEGVMLILRLHLDPVAAHGVSTRVRHSRTPTDFILSPRRTLSTIVGIEQRHYDYRAPHLSP